MPIPFINAQQVPQSSKFVFKRNKLKKNPRNVPPSNFKSCDLRVSNWKCVQCFQLEECLNNKKIKK